MMEKQTIVVKVGTSSLTLSDGTMDAEKIRNITTQLAALQTAGHHVILVSSGAIAAGFSRLGFKKRPTKIADKQAAAAVGQGLLMEEYTKNLMAYQIPGAQILLNRSDFEDRRRYKNIFGSLSVLLGRGAIPIINENDTIAIEELKVGDNDTLSAQVAAMLHASLLILLTDIDGLYTANPKSDPNARHIDVVNEITPELTAAAGGAGSGNGTGGMTTKLSAASLATRAGVPVLICSSAEENNIVRAVKGTAKGTYFTASGHNMKTRLQWMAFYAPSAGNLYVDEGAAEALAVQAKSLLPKGIVAVEGDFKKGDVVSVFRRGSHEYLGKGIVNYNRPDLQKIMNESTSHTEAINRDNWIGADKWCRIKHSFVYENSPPCYNICIQPAAGFSFSEERKLHPVFHVLLVLLREHSKHKGGFLPMKYDFTSLMNRSGHDSIAVDQIPIPGAEVKEGFSRIPMWVADMNFPSLPTIQEAIHARVNEPHFWLL